MTPPTILYACLFATASAFAGAQQLSNAPSIVAPADVRASALAAASHRAAAVSVDSKIRIWDSTNGYLLQTIPIAATDIDGIAISPDGSWVLAADHKGKITVWDAATGRVRLQTQLAHYAASVMFSHDSKLLAIAVMGGPTEVFDLATVRQLYEVTSAFGTGAIAFSRDGRYFADADTDTAVRIYETKTGKLIAENHDFKLEPMAIDFTRDGRQVIAAGADQVIAYIDSTSGKMERKSKRLDEPIVYLEVSPDGESLALLFMKAENMTQAAPIAVWSVGSMEKKSDWMPPRVVMATNWSQDGHLMATTVDGKQLGVWQVP